MSLWTESTDIYNVLDTLIEDQTQSIELPVVAPDSVEIISGNLPPGMRVQGDSIIGKPDKVFATTRYTFTLRAIKDDSIEDRTFSINVTGKSSPYWITPAGELHSEITGDLAALYATDGTVVNLQLLAADEDEDVGEILHFMVTSGELPPGLTLTDTGFLYGIMGARVQLPNGKLINFTYDYPHPNDFIMGYHSNFYDLTDKSSIISAYSSYFKLNKEYKFEISVFDGKTDPVTREFSIMLGGTNAWALGGFTAPMSGTEVYWLTPENLGFYRANKNVTIYLDVIDPATMTGFADYTLMSYNWDGTVSELPEGLELDVDRGLIYGKTPALYTSKKEYKILVGASSFYSPSVVYKTFNITLVHEDFVDFVWESPGYMGTMKIYEKSFKKLTAVPTVSNNNTSYELVSGSLPDGLILTTDGYINGNILPIDPTHTGKFEFTVKAWNNNNFAGNEKKFTIMVDTVDKLLYNEVYIKPFMDNDKRNIHNRLLSNTELFNSECLFRPEDPDFGLNEDLRMLLCSSVDTVELHNYYPLLHGLKRRILRYNGLKHTPVLSPGTRTALYEVIYVELIDPLKGTDNALSNLRNDITQLGDVDLRNERLWLRSLRYTNNYNDIIAFPIAFVKVGYGEIITKQITATEFYDIHNYDFDIERIIVVSSLNTDDAKYVLFTEREPQIFL